MGFFSNMREYSDGIILGRVNFRGRIVFNFIEKKKFKILKKGRFFIYNWVGLICECLLFVIKI